jgi:hypothetical protein
MTQKEDFHTAKVLDNLFGIKTEYTPISPQSTAKPIRRCKDAIKNGFKLALPTTKQQLAKSVKNADYRSDRSNTAIPKPKRAIALPKNAIAVIDVLDIGLLVRYEDRIELKLRQIKNNKKSSEGIIINLSISIDNLRESALQLCFAGCVDSFYEATKIAIATECKWLVNYDDRVGCSLTSLRQLAMMYKLAVDKLSRALLRDLALLMKDTTDQRSIHALPLTIDI